MKRQTALRVVSTSTPDPAPSKSVRGRDRLHEAAIRVAGYVCTRALEAGDHEASRHAWTRMERLIAARSLPQILAMEYHAGLR